MKQVTRIGAMAIVLLFINGCTSTFAGTIFVISFRDIIYYTLLSFILALIIGMYSENKKRGFWIWFILNLALTPLSGFIYLLAKISKRI